MQQGSSLFDKWHLYMKDISSPDCFIDMSFYYMIGAALQRRVWLGPPDKPVFANTYIILVAEPGVGKGLVIKPVTDILKFHKISPETEAQKNLNIDRMIENLKATNPDPNLLDALYKSRDALANIGNPIKNIKRERNLIPVAADSTTYESLVQVHAASVSKINVTPCEMAPGGLYTHHSLCFSLEEISSLFRKNQQAIVNYLLVAYDCSNEYVYETKSSGTDRIRKCCLSLFGGTTPNFMQKTFDESLLTEGFSSRTWFVYGAEPRHNYFDIPPLSPEQKNARHDIIDRIKVLSTLFGQTTYTEEAREFLEDYFRNIFPKRKTNPLEVLKPYYSRKNIHVRKLSMALHFADNDDFIIPKSTAQKAIEILDEIEIHMHNALAFNSRNPMASLYKRIHSFLQKEGEKSLIEIWQRFVSDFMNVQEVQGCLEFLMVTKKIEAVEKNKTMKYKSI